MKINPWKRPDPSDYEPKNPVTQSMYRSQKRIWGLVKHRIGDMKPEQRKHFLEMKGFLDAFDQKKITYWYEYYRRPGDGDKQELSSGSETYGREGTTRLLQAVSDKIDGVSPQATRHKDKS